MVVQQKIGFLTQRNRVIMLAFIVLSIMCIFMNYNLKIVKYYRVRSLPDTRAYIENKLIKALKRDSEQGCVVPRLDPFSKTLLKFVMEYPPVKCAEKDWVKCYYSQCKMDSTILSTMTNVVCRYRDILSTGDDYRRLGIATKVKGSEVYNLLSSDHVYVECSGRKKLDTIISIFPSTWSGYATGLRPVVPKPSTLGRDKMFNILILAFDSAAKNGFIRKMPKSYKVLIEEIDATVLNGYNIVGEGTAATLFPILTGKRDLELPDARKGITLETMDVYPLIFYKLAALGYRTAYFEDSPWTGTFQQRYNGFKKQPTDHYMYPFLMYESNDGEKWWARGEQKYCIGDTLSYKVLLNVTQQFMSLKANKRFGFTFISDITHDDFNRISMADDDVAEFLRSFVRDHAEDTMLMVMGDHGPRFGDICSTAQGKLERRLPLMAIRLPDKLVRDRPEVLDNLKHNANVLTTPHDIHATLLDVLDLPQYQDSYKLLGANTTRALTLLEPIASTRGCSEAGVEPHWCACLTWRNVSTAHPLYTRAATQLLNNINQLTEPFRSMCAARTLSTIHWVVIHQIRPGVLSYVRSKDGDGYIASFTRNKTEVVDMFQVKVSLLPGKAEYEGTLNYYADEDKFDVKISDITRNDAYGQEPICISDKFPHLNIFCYCKNHDIDSFTAFQEE